MSSLAQAARRELSRLDAASFFDRWIDLAAADRIGIALALHATDEQGMADGLIEALAGGGTRDERLAAIDLVRRLGLAADLEDTLVAAASGDDLRVVSAAMTALAGNDSLRSYSILKRGLAHDDPRVVANAIEALSRRGRASAAELMAPFVDVRQNRSRGNAIRALMRHHHRAGVEDLKAMLSDDDPLHRVSAIWVARQSRATPVLTDLVRLAGGDRIGIIRTRAEEAARRLERMELVGAATTAKRTPARTRIRRRKR